jgi:hypothetical protein
MDQNSNFTPGAFAHFGANSRELLPIAIHIFEFGSFAHFWGLRQGLSLWAQTQNFTPGLLPIFALNFVGLSPGAPNSNLTLVLLPIFGTMPYPIIAPKLKILLWGLLPIFGAR